MPSLFLSHSSRDKFFVRELAERLRDAGVHVWIDEAEIRIGDSLTDKIGRAITDVDYVGVVLSHNSVNSEWVQRELQIALQRELQVRQVIVLPLLLERVEIPPFLTDKVYADFTSADRYEVEFPKLLRALGLPSDRISPLPPAPPATRVEEHPKLSPVERRLANFDDVRIIELDSRKSFKPDPEKLLYNIYLRLSSAPPSEWQQIFEAERRFPRHNMWRRAWIEGQYIVVHCVPDELEKYHMRDLSEDVANANSKFREFLMSEARREVNEQVQVQREREELNSIRSRLGL